MGQEEKITKISIDLIIPNAHQPRKIFNNESLKELSLSIKEYGILNPILVRKKDNLYEIIAGERRYRAAKLANLTEVPVIIKEVDELKLAEIALIENLQRENISPIEEAKSYEEILKLSNLREQDLSNMVGKSQSYISNKLRLLKLPPVIQEALINKKISERHARSLITVNDIDKQTELLNRVINEKLTVKELDTIINEKEITDAEIKSAIDDIMKSLNISNDLENNKKEEKESDKMNNGNFFPNTNQNLGTDQNISLNSMNMQTLNTMPNQPLPGEMPVAGPATMPSFDVQQPSSTYNQPTQEIPAASPMASTSPIPNFGISPMPEAPAPQVPTLEVPSAMPSIEPLVQNTPVDNNMGMPLSYEQPVGPEISAPNPMMDQPLFDPNSQILPQSQPAMPTEPSVPSMPSYEVPVTTEMPLPPVEPQNKLVEVQTFLNNNGINYKTYSNETGNCIIIEL